MAQRGETAAAEKPLGGTIDLNPDASTAHLWLTNLLYRGKRTDEARRFALAATQKWPNEATGYSLLGNILLELGMRLPLTSRSRKPNPWHPETLLILVSPS